MRKQSTYRPKRVSPPMLINRGLIETGPPRLTGSTSSERTGNGTKNIAALTNGVTVTTHKMRG